LRERAGERTHIADRVHVAPELLAPLVGVGHACDVDLERRADLDEAVLVERLGEPCSEELRVGLLAGAAQLFRAGESESALHA